MKITKLLYGALALSSLTLTSCNDWLDVNTDPDNPTDQSATYSSRLAHCQFYMNDAQVFAGFRNSGTVGDIQSYNGRSYVTNMGYWLYSGAASATTTPYQWFFVGCGSNLQDMYDKAMAAEAWHYAGAAKLIKAYGYMLMTDLYGEMPYEEGLGESATPKFSDGKTIFKGCMDDIDEAIELFSKTQDPGKTDALSVGDAWNGGDVNKWLKMAYLFKARWINHLTKKGAGSYKDLKWDSAEILACLAKAQQSNADNTVINHTDDNSKTHDVLGWDEPVDYNGLYSVIGMNSNYFVSKMLVDNLTNFDGKNVEDPRADKIIPWAHNNGYNVPAQLEGKIKYTGEWRRSLGVDMQDVEARTQGMPFATSWKNGFYCDDKTGTRLADTLYVQTTTSSKGYAQNKDLLYRRGGQSADNSAMSGSFHVRVSAPGYVATYSEACFIKAEVLFNTGDKAGAYSAYKAGVEASIRLMNEKLNVWCAEDPSLADCPSFTPMQESDIQNYLNTALGTESDLTLDKIMTQKRLHMLFHMENYNDMRRYDYDTKVFQNWQIPAQYTQNLNNQFQYIPQGQAPRRWRQCSHELNYNSVNLQAMVDVVPGARKDVEAWNAADDVWTIPVWWDSTQN